MALKMVALAPSGGLLWLVHDGHAAVAGRLTRADPHGQSPFPSLPSQVCTGPREGGGPGCSGYLALPSFKA